MSFLRDGATGKGRNTISLGIDQTKMVRCFMYFPSSDWSFNIPLGVYEFEYQAPAETDDSTATSAHADFRGSETPRCVSSHDTAQANSGQNSLSISLDYTHESSIPDLDLNKGKQPETGDYMLFVGSA